MSETSKEKYDRLKEAGSLNVKSGRTSDILANPIINAIKSSWEESVRNGKTEVPFDMKECKANGMDFNHSRDKFRRCVQIACLSEVYPNEVANLKGIYGSETTALLNEKVPKSLFVTEANKELGECFVSVDVSELLNNEESAE